MPGDQPESGGINTPRWALIIVAALVGVGLIGNQFFDVLDDLRPRACKHFGIGCIDEGDTPQLTCDPNTMKPKDYDACSNRTN